MEASNSDGTELDRLREQFFSASGRLLWRYQTIEAVAKVLGTALDVTVVKNEKGYVVDGGERYFTRKTLGEIRHPLTQRLFPAEDPVNEIEEVEQLSARAVFRIAGDDPEFRNDFERDFATLVQHRNQLAHHLPDRVSLNKRESIEDGIALVRQWLNHAEQVQTRLTSFLKRLMAARTAAAEVLEHPEVIALFDEAAAALGP